MFSADIKGIHSHIWVIGGWGKVFDANLVVISGLEHMSIKAR